MKKPRSRCRTSLAGFISALLVAVSADAATTITVTSADDAGGSCPGATCTLRQAIATAASGDTINFAAGLSTITLTSAELLINKNLTISGPGANLLTVRRSDAAGNFRIFDITSGGFNTISGLTISNGLTTSVGGGINNASTSTVNVTNCTVSGNQAAGGGLGGGINNDSSGGTVNVTNCTLSGNSSGDGGGILNNGGTVTVTSSTISGNSATGPGGGIRHVLGTVTITNSTITGNTASGFSGSGGGIYSNSGGTLNARNTIIAKNTATSAPDFQGALTSQGYNLIGDTSGTTITGTTTGNQLNVDPKLGPLQDNGGPTFTHALLSGSTAIEGGNSSGSTRDQRGVARPVDTPAIANASGGDGSDIGAYEVQASLLPGCDNTIVTNNNDSGAGSLRSIIAGACGGEAVTFASSVVSPINLTSGELLINKALLIIGPGSNLLTVQRGASAGSNFRIFHITSGSYNTIGGLTIANGNPDDVGGGIYNQFGSELLVTFCAVSGNFAGSVGGGGVANIGATATIFVSTISGNSTGTSGGGIANAFGTVTITNSTISGNSAMGSGTDGGGGIFNGSSGGLNLTNSTITNNSATNFGGCGGVQNPSGAVNARNTIIALNTGTGFGFPDFRGTLTSQGFNFIGNSQGATITPAQFTDQIGTGASPKDPLLGPLKNNGGSTQTHALLAGSTAIDKGDSGGAAIDQRIFIRPVDLPGITNVTGGDGGDIGAFEVQATVLANISTRLRVQTGDNVLIGGMIATGTAGKRVIIRAIGPSLIPFGIPGALANPTLDLFQGSTLLFSNDDWNSSTQQAEIAASGLAPSNAAEAAIIWTLMPSQGYTAVVRGKNGATGIGVVEAYDLDQAAASKLGNISTRGFVDVDDNVMIAGFIAGLGDGTSLKVLVRALGPTLSDFGVPGALANPTLDLVNASGTVIRSNNNWKDDPLQRALIEAAGLAPAHDEEAALVETVAPGAYTAIVRGNNRGTGVGLVEAYNIP